MTQTRHRMTQTIDPGATVTADLADLAQLDTAVTDLLAQYAHLTDRLTRLLAAADQAERGGATVMRIDTIRSIAEGRR